MKMQISRANMLAEEMTRLAIDHLLRNRLTYSADFRLLEISFKSPGLFAGSDMREIEVQGWLAYSSESVSELSFSGKMAIERVDDRWVPRRIQFTAFIDSKRRNYVWSMGANCIETPRSSGFRKFEVSYK